MLGKVWVVFKVALPAKMERAAAQGKGRVGIDDIVALGGSGVDDQGVEIQRQRAGIDSGGARVGGGGQSIEGQAVGARLGEAGGSRDGAGAGKPETLQVVVEQDTPRVDRRVQGHCDGVGAAQGVRKHHVVPVGVRRRRPAIHPVGGGEVPSAAGRRPRQLTGRGGGNQQVN